MVWGGDDGLANLAVVAVRDIFGERDDEGEPAATYTTPDGSTTVTVLVPFDRAFESVSFDSGGAPHAGTDPVVDVRLADLVDDAGDRVELERDGIFVIAGVRYSVREVEPGSDGIDARAFLTEAPES